MSDDACGQLAGGDRDDGLVDNVALTCCDSGVMLMISGVSGVH